MIGRRALLAGGAALALAPRAARALDRGDADAGALAALDAAMASSTAAERVTLLERAPPREGLSEGRRLDLADSLAGARVEAEIARIYPFTGPMGSPYPVSPLAGAWRAAGRKRGEALTQRIDAETERVRMATAQGFALPSSLTAQTLAGLKAARAAARDGAVAAALGRQAEAIEAAAAHVSAGDGLRRAPGGKRLFALLLELHAGEALDPDDFHARIAALIADLTRRADALLKAEGLTRGGVGERLRAFARDPRFLYPDSNAGRDRAVADMNRWLAAARARLPRQFGRIPPGAETVRARRMASADERARRGGYRILPDPAAGEPGGYFVDLSHIRARPTWSLPSVVHHELLPGHMIQLPLQAEAGPHPLRLRYAPGFVEGWAVYAEELSDDSGAFADSSPARIGYLQWMLFRAGRALAETGVHLEGWGLAETSARLAALQGDPAIFAPFEREAERAALQPGAFSGQAWNWRVFTELAEASGPTGSPARRRFHDHALAFGARRIPGLRRRRSMAI